MALTDEQISLLRWQCKWTLMSTNDDHMYATKQQVDAFARAIESAVTAPLLERIAEQDETLRFVERWANHHGTEPNMTPGEALSCIQHYPAIRAITHGYVDGQMPSTSKLARP